MMPEFHRPLRRWQEEALRAWNAASKRGIVTVVTGGGKTFFALKCVNEFQRQIPGATVLITVPTEALLDQWFEELVSFFDMPSNFLNLVSKTKPIQRGRMNIGVINTVAKLASSEKNPHVFLVVDECHKSASPSFRDIFNIPRVASLGLSATPDRPYDDWLNEILIPELGPVIYTYTYKDAMRDAVIVPFELRNILFDFTAEEQSEYDKLTRNIRVSIAKHGVEAEKSVMLLLKRARFVNSSPTRISIAIKLIARHRGNKILVFHEDINACNVLYQVLKENAIPTGIYHSKMTLQNRVQTLQDYRAGRTQVLVSCRALDEGFNVPETEIGIIAASTATYRQRVQRLGRVLRPAEKKRHAIIYSIVASAPEIRRLACEAEDLKEIATVKWSRV